VADSASPAQIEATAASEMLTLECLLFVQEQSCGEWGEQIEMEDAGKLAAFVQRQIARHRATAIAQQDALIGELVEAALFAWRRLDLTGDDCETADKLFSALTRASQERA
jgi:hypothetical protein